MSGSDHAFGYSFLTIFQASYGFLDSFYDDKSTIVHTDKDFAPPTLEITILYNRCKFNQIAQNMQLEIVCYAQLNFRKCAF